MNLFRPTPETALPDYRLTFFPELVMKVDRILPAFVYHQRHLMIVSCFGPPPLDFSGDVGRCDFTLEHSHMSHLRPRKTNRVSDGIKSLCPRRAHIVVHTNVALTVCDI